MTETKTNNVNEIWIDIKDYEDLYQVSNFGNIRSFDRVVRCGSNAYRTIEGRILKKLPDKDGYEQVVLYKDRKATTKKVHRLVVEAFIDNINNYKCVNHKDEDKTNNHVDNLEWCTVKYNNNYGNKNEKCSNTLINNKSHCVKIVQLSKNGDYINEWNSVKDASNNLKLKLCDISRVIKTNGSCGGFLWMHHNDYLLNGSKKYIDKRKVKKNDKR